MIRKLFFVIVIAILLSAWFLRCSRKPEGFFDVVHRPTWSARGFLKGTFQTQCEKYLGRNFPGLGPLLYFKNDVYDLLNLGLFHAGYNGAIIQGKNGVLLENVYIFSACQKISPGLYEHYADIMAVALSRLKALLTPRNVQLVLVMAPGKTDFALEHLPPLWKARCVPAPHTSAAVAPLTAQRLGARKIMFVNCHDSIVQNGAQMLAFPATGTHWSMYAAGLCLADMSRVLHAADPGIFPLVKVTGRTTTTQAKHEERDLADLLNLWPPYASGVQEFPLAEFSRVSHSVPLTLVGDSFGGQLIDNMLLSGYIRNGSWFRFTNHIPPKKAFVEAIAQSRVLVVIATSTKFMVEDNLQRLLNVLASYLEGTENETLP